MNGFGHGWSMGFGWLVSLLIITVLYYLISSRKINKSSEGPSAQDILGRCYASGGISQDEYDEKSKHLRENR